MEIKRDIQENGETQEIGTDKTWGIEKLPDRAPDKEMTRLKADEVLSGRVWGSQEAGGISVESPESAKRYLDRANGHMVKSREYEYQANNLEREIQRGRQPANRMSEVRSLRQKASSEKREADRCKSYAQMELSRI